VRYHCLASDYDGTLALHGHVNGPTAAALKRLRDSSRALVLVTGRELDELLGIFPNIHLFDWVVAENGGLLYHPATKAIRPLADPPDERFVQRLRERGVAKLSVGRVIVATWEPYETVVLEAIRDLGLGLQVIFNKGAVMVLPSGVTKATGLKTALAELGLSRHNTVAVGDAENDHAMLTWCECGVAVANALPALKERADWVTGSDHGEGVAQVVDALLTDDLSAVTERIARHDVTLGRRDGEDICIRPYGLNLLIAGSSGSGKSCIARSLLERLSDATYQACIVDPEGDFCELEQAVSVGTSQQPPTLDEVLQVLHKPRQSVVANLEALPPAERRGFFAGLLPRIADLRKKKGVPHWLLVDEADQLMPHEADAANVPLMPPCETLWIAVEPRKLAVEVLKSVEVIVTVGDRAHETLEQALAASGEPDVRVAPAELHADEAILYRCRSGQPPQVIDILASRAQQREHQQEFVHGNLGPERSFVFRGPLNKLKLRAQNLSNFLLMAEGIDDETWLHHLQQGDYSRWIREAVRDPHLGDEAARIETERGLSAEESRARMRHVIEKHYKISTNGSAATEQPRADAAAKA
jgi:HAD superfamily hydrolase (TIGR01484 family)